MSLYSKKAQVSFEYISIVALLLVLITPLFYFIFTETVDRTSVYQLQDAVDSVVGAADNVASLGYGSKQHVWITLPGSVQGVYINGTELFYQARIGGDLTDFVAFSDVELTGSLPTGKGRYEIAVELLSSGVVQIGEGNDTTAPIITWTSPDNLTCNPITLRVTTNEATNCKFSETDEDYNLMSNNMDGSGLSHSYFFGVVEEGNYTYYATCQDTYGNKMTYTEEINYLVNTSKCYAEESNDTADNNSVIVVALLDVGVDETYYFKSTSAGIETEDAQMSSWVNITDDLLDDNSNTPSVSYLARTRTGNNYEGYVATLDDEASRYEMVTISGRVKLIDESPFYIRIYPYYSNGSINTNVYVDHQINDSILSEKVKWSEVDITDIVHTENGTGEIRVRITARDLSAQLNDRLSFTELHYNVG